jgi:PPK2 family polyphosphate:nucleotide phosphotransferase
MKNLEQGSHHLDHKHFLVEPGQKVRLKDYPPDFTGGIRDKAEAKMALLEDVSGLAAAQDLLWASRKYAIVIVLQALDAAGKDGTIKHVMSGVNPQGVFVRSFKAPSLEERIHHFLWRPMRVLPGAGEIAIFNRSYYEEVLVVRVHPEFLDGQWLAPSQRQQNLSQLWPARYRDINTFEQHLAQNGTLVLKFFLHVSREEQKLRFLARLDKPEKNWKFSAADVRERGYWSDYQQAYEEMLSATSTADAPWYIIPADRKWFTRACVADIIVSRIAKLDLKYPTVSEKQRAALEEARKQLLAEEKL